MSSSEFCGAILLTLGPPTGSHSRRCGLRQETAVSDIQSTRCLIVALRFRRFGMDTELCGCALLGGKEMRSPTVAEPVDEWNDREQ